LEVSSFIVGRRQSLKTWVIFRLLILIFASPLYTSKQKKKKNRPAETCRNPHTTRIAPCALVKASFSWFRTTFLLVSPAIAENSRSPHETRTQTGWPQNGSILKDPSFSWFLTSFLLVSPAIAENSRSPHETRTQFLVSARFYLVSRMAPKWVHLKIGETKCKPAETSRKLAKTRVLSNSVRTFPDIGETR
jgi:hypothetical protein